MDRKSKVQQLKEIKGILEDRVRKYQRIKSDISTLKGRREPVIREKGYYARLASQYRTKSKGLEGKITAYESSIGKLLKESKKLEREIQRYRAEIAKY